MKTRQCYIMLVAIFTMVAMLAISGCKKKDTYMVSFDANGGTGEMAGQVFSEGESRALVGNAFSYQGHTFKSWNTMKNGTGTSYDDGQNITVTSDMTLYAQWKKIVSFVIVSFDANGGTGEMRPQRYEVGSPQVLRPNEFTNPDYYFYNWNTEADGSGISYLDMQEITVSGNMTLYAQWAVNGTPPPGPLPGDDVTVTFDANGGNGYMAPQIYMVGVAQSLTANEFTKENYWFAGWNTTADGSGIAYANTEEITITENVTLYAQWKVSYGEAAGYVWVDLGLPSGTLWATCNVGASVPEEYGNYYAWGETLTKSNYTWYDYKYCYNGLYYESSLTKYCNIADFGYQGFTDNLGILQPEDDAATANWGADWRMPTWAEMNELVNNCSSEWTVQNGVNGKLFTGPSGNTVFFPAAGEYSEYANGRLVNVGDFGFYWTNTLATVPSLAAPHRSCALYFQSSFIYELDVHVGFDERCNGLSVRPVCVSTRN